MLSVFLSDQGMQQPGKDLGDNTISAKKMARFTHLGTKLLSWLGGSGENGVRESVLGKRKAYCFSLGLLLYAGLQWSYSQPPLPVIKALVLKKQEEACF